MGWDTRLAWSGEQPADEATLLQRFDTVTGSGSTRTAPDAVGRNWTIRGYANTANIDASRWGQRLTFNLNAPATERTSLAVPHFAGMWPSSGKVLLSVWAALRYGMNFTPIISTRNSGVAPLVYLSTMSDGRPRAQVYNAAGQLILDQSETLPYSVTIGEWVCYMMLLDMDAKTSQLATVRHTAADAHLAPVRSFTGDPNPACTADFEALTLAPTANYWANGRVDEIGLFHPGEDFNFADHVESVRLACWADGSNHETGDASALHVTDQRVTATSAATLHTGAEQRSWLAQPSPQPYEALSGDPRAFLSSDNGQTWSEALTPGELPETFDGLVRWEIPLEQGETFRGLDLVERQPVPTIDPIGPVTIPQHGATEVTVTGSWIGTPRLHLVATPGIRAVVDGTTITIASGLDAGEHRLTVSITDDTGQTSEPFTIHVNVTVEPWDPPEAPQFARAAIVVHNAAGTREAVIEDPTSAVRTLEVNGEHVLTFAVPASHPKAHLLVNERHVEAAGDFYRIRKVTTTRDTTGTPLREVFCEALWYDLRVAGRVRERDFTGAQAGQALQYVLEGKGWSIGTVNVTTRRTWTMENQTTLAALRAIADVHGGDLVLDGENKTVSLVTFAGRDRGVAFFHGQALSDATRVEDTTNLITRIEPRNEEGIGIEAVNGGVPWLEDFTYTNEVRHGVYNFASGTSPQTMMAMTVAAIGKRAYPAVSYEATVADLSAWSGQEIDRFDTGDRVLIVDPELGIETVQRIVAMDYDLLRPWESKVTLSEKLRELGGDSSSGVDAGVLTTGADIDTRDLVPFNLLRNARFDNGLAHWAASGVQVVDGGVTGSRSARLGPGTRWLEQTVATDTRDAYTFSMQVEHRGGPQQWVPDLTVVAEITLDDGTTETITLELT